MKGKYFFKSFVWTIDFTKMTYFEVMLIFQLNFKHV